ncbi:hypothetical protein [Phyllobacterium sp. SB3]|uniref:hypothetical protein n=1 Tax=Phyllobacterium sp. SB3 TaxID=3156073 RepID=UPI0032B01EA8
MSADFYAPFLLSVIISFGCPTFQTLLLDVDGNTRSSPVEITVASALGVSSVGLALTQFGAVAGCTLVALGILITPLTNRLTQHSIYRITSSFLLFLLYLRLEKI